MRNHPYTSRCEPNPMSDQRRLTVPTDLDMVRSDKVIATLLDVSRSEVRRMLQAVPAAARRDRAHR